MSALSRLMDLCTPSARSLPSAAAPACLAMSHSRPYALVIEGHQEIAECMRCALEELRVFSMISHDVESGLKMARAMHFNLLILDVLIPGMDGLAVCRAIRKTPALREVPVMFVNCVTSAEAQAQAAGLGVAHCLCQPFEPAEFQTQVERILAEEAQRRPKRRPNMPPV